jgi:lysozyme family protein
MKSNMDVIMDHVFVSEGGYAERDSEPGGAVNMGISFQAFDDWWENSGKQDALLRRATWNDLRNLSRDEAEQIYRQYYFDPLRFGQLPSGVDYCFVDFAVNSGVGGAIRAVQRHWGFPVTGKIDTNFQDGAFFWALRSRDPKRVIDDICESRLILMMSSRKWPRFSSNWKRRLRLVKQRCYAMAGIDERATIDVEVAA